LNLDLNEETEAAAAHRAGIRRKRSEGRWRARSTRPAFPRETFRKAAELGLTAVALPESEGGAGFDHIATPSSLRNFPRLRFHRRDSLGTKLPVLRSHSSVSAPRSRKRISRAVRARRKKLAATR